MAGIFIGSLKVVIAVTMATNFTNLIKADSLYFTSNQIMIHFRLINVHCYTVSRSLVITELSSLSRPSWIGLIMN